MANWTTNTIMLWDGQKVSDHSRSTLSVSNERIGSDKRMSNGTLRRFHVRTAKTWSMSWSFLPSVNILTPINGRTFMKTADGGMSGTEMEAFYNANPGSFRMVVKSGSASGKNTPNPSESSLPFETDDFYICNVMFSEFSKEVIKRGTVDLWSVTVSLEEV